MSGNTDIVDTLETPTTKEEDSGKKTTKTYTPKKWDRPAYTNYSPYWYQNGSTLQPDHMTKADRFPKIFESAQKMQPNAKRVLSFGCSTGEECQSLRKYFPNAEIVGVDIDWGSIKKARDNNKDDRIFFHTDLGATGKYDLCLCLMVFFCMEFPVPYERFEETLQKLNKYINEDGLLMIYTSDHNPSWVPEIVQEYEPVNVFIREHNKNKKEYYNGYYRKLAKPTLY